MEPLSAAVPVRTHTGTMATTRLARPADRPTIEALVRAAYGLPSDIVLCYAIPGSMIPARSRAFSYGAGHSFAARECNLPPRGCPVRSNLKPLRKTGRFAMKFLSLIGALAI